MGELGKWLHDFRGALDRLSAVEAFRACADLELLRETYGEARRIGAVGVWSSSVPMVLAVLERAGVVASVLPMLGKPTHRTVRWIRRKGSDSALVAVWRAEI